MMGFDFIRWRFHFIRGRFHYSECIKYCQKYDAKPHFISTHNLDVYATWEIEPKNLGFTQMTSQGGVEGQTILLILAPMCFLWNNLCQFVVKYNGANHWLLEQGWDGQQHLTAPLWKCMSGIGDHRFTFLVDLLSNYTSYTNLTIFSIRRLLIEDVTSLIVLNLWKVEKIMQHRLISVEVQWRQWQIKLSESETVSNTT